jgi:hypothetical protein
MLDHLARHNRVERTRYLSNITNKRIDSTVAPLGFVVVSDIHPVTTDAQHARHLEQAAVSAANVEQTKACWPMQSTPPVREEAEGVPGVCLGIHVD